MGTRKDRVDDNFEHRVDDHFTFGFLRTNRGTVTNRFASGVRIIVFLIIHIRLCNGILRMNVRAKANGVTAKQGCVRY